MATAAHSDIHTHTRTLAHTDIKHTQIHRQCHTHSIGLVGLWALWACSDNIVVQLSTPQTHTTHTPYASKQIAAAAEETPNSTFPIKSYCPISISKTCK